MDAINFLFKFIFDAAIMVVVLRIWLQLVRADFYNPISQFVVKVSNPLVIPMRRIIPDIAGIDLPTVVLAYLISACYFILITLLNGGQFDLLLAFILGLIYFIKQVGALIFFIMLIMALMSWVVQGYNPTQALFQQLTEPLLKPIRNIIPNIGGLDLSVLVFFLLLTFVNKLLAGWLPYWGML